MIMIDPIRLHTFCQGFLVLGRKDYLRLRDLQSLKMQRAVARACLQEVALHILLEPILQ